MSRFSLALLIGYVRGWFYGKTGMWIEQAFFAAAVGFVIAILFLPGCGTASLAPSYIVETREPACERGSPGCLESGCKTPMKQRLWAVTQTQTFPVRTDWECAPGSTPTNCKKVEICACYDDPDAVSSLLTWVFAGFKDCKNLGD